MQQRQQTGGRGRAYLFLGISLITAVIAAYLVITMLNKAADRADAQAQETEVVDVVVATRNLYMGLPVQEGDVSQRQLAPWMVPADVVFTSADMVIGRTPKERILSNEIIRSERLARREAGVGLNAVITPGKRAVSIGVKAEEAVAGFIRPLNYVDVIVVIKPDDTKEAGAKAVSKTLLQGIKVMAIGDSLAGLEGDERETGVTADGKKKKQADTKKKKSKTAVKGKRTVTLEVTLEEAEELALASAKGEIVLALRADIDITQIETHGATANSLIGLDPKEDAPTEVMRPRYNRRPAKKAEPAAAPKPTIDVIQGGNKQVLTAEDDGSGVTEVKQKKIKR